MSPDLRRLPAVHQLMKTRPLQDAADTFGRPTVRDACRAAVDDLRSRAADDGCDDTAFQEACKQLPMAILARLEAEAAPAYDLVINATGVLLHTNLGRAPLSAAEPLTPHYLALEFSLETGQRGQRLQPLRERIARTCGAEWAVMVNNNAASLLLILSAIAKGREVIVSRSQLIEIGGSFRLPAVMEASGSRLVEVGCTNRTHLKDYEEAIGENTAAILVAHQSNFRIVGFTTEPPLAELIDLAHRHDLPMIMDQGSGCLHDLGRWGLPHEKTVAEILDAGADLVCFSGDKLLGGPQAGIIVGAKSWVEPLGRHPLYRALRPDKHALIKMDETLQAHASGHLGKIPLYAMLETPVDQLKNRAGRLGRALRRQDVPVRGKRMRAALGGGTTPAETVDSYGLSLSGGQRLADLLRRGDPPVVARIDDDQVLFDLRTVLSVRDSRLEVAILQAYRKLQEIQDSGE